MYIFTGAVTYTKPATDTNTYGHFKYHFYCTGREKNITDCRISQREVDNILCSDDNVTALMCETGTIMLKIKYLTIVTLIVTIIGSVRTTPTSDAQREANSSPLPWVAGIIIGAVLSTAILLTVIVAVYLWRKKAQSRTKCKIHYTTCILLLHSHYNRSDCSTERRVSMSQTNQCYSNVTNVTQEPQAYEEFQPNRQGHQPAAAEGVYSYADHTVNTNVYDSVPQSNESSDSYGNSKEDTTMPTVDNTALYSLCEQENGAYSQLNRK